jgi:DNA-binding response OmpR family regulator
MAAGDEHVLIVESDILVRQPLADYLRECGYKVVEAVDAAEARRLISEGKFHIDVVLADVDAGQENGFALAQWVRKNHPDIDVMLAGTIEKATEQAGTLCEEGPMLTKPYEHQLVLNRIKQSIAGRERKRREEE